MRKVLFFVMSSVVVLGIWACNGSLQTNASSPDVWVESQASASSRNGAPGSSLPEECGSLPPDETPDTAVTVRCSCTSNGISARWVASRSVQGRDGSFCASNLLYAWQVIRVKARPVVDAGNPVPVAASASVAVAASITPASIAPPVASASITSTSVEYTCKIDAATQIAKREAVKDGKRTEIQRCAGPGIACVEKGQQQDLSVPPCTCQSGKALVQAPANVWTCQPQ